MGDPRKLKPIYETPKKVLDKDRIVEERAIKGEYGLKNTREVWIALRKVKNVRRQVRKLLAMGEGGMEKRNQIMSKLTRLGIMKEGSVMEDVLTLTIKDFLDRRLQSRVQKKGLARTMKQARQLITHGFISVKGRRVNSPGYMVTLNEEPTISYTKPIDLEVKMEEEASGSEEAEAGPEEKEGEGA